MILTDWAIRWSIPAAALQDLHLELGLDSPPPDPAEATSSEAWAQSMARIKASRSGGRLWRNNVGTLPNPNGVPVRFGLANDSKLVNGEIKSADLIGIRPRIVTPNMIGMLIGQFWSRECKPPGWHYTGTEREVAQLRWANQVLRLGGDAAFYSGGENL